MYYIVCICRPTLNKLIIIIMFSKMLRAFEQALRGGMGMSSCLGYALRWVELETRTFKMLSINI